MAKKSNVTLKDVSEVAGVSMMTVSNVVHGHFHSVGVETRERVQLEINRLNYRPNISARNLRALSSNSIGMVISNSEPDFLSDPFIAQLVSGLSNFLSSRDFSLDIQGTVPERFEDAGIMRKASNDALCAVLCGPQSMRQQNIDYLKGIDQPTVIFQEPIRCRGVDIAIIRQDDEGGGFELGKHLVKQKVKKVMFVRPVTDWPAIEQRERGLRAALDESRRRVTCETIESDSEGFQDVKAAVKQYIEHSRPDAIVAATDSMGIAAMRMCEEKGLSAPGDIRVAGFNGFSAWQYATPALTTVISPAYDMGRCAGEVLLGRLQDGRFNRKSIVLPTQLLVGEST